MKRSEVNSAVNMAKNHFEKHNWNLPPSPRWDVTDFGLGEFDRFGLVLVNLTEEQEYCEKIMFAKKGQTTPAHAHKVKKEDIICREGTLCIQCWKDYYANGNGNGKSLTFELKLNGEYKTFKNGETVELKPGERLTITQHIYHEFYPSSDYCIIGEVSTANDDENDNYFINPMIGRFSEILEDEQPAVKLVSDTF